MTNEWDVVRGLPAPGKLMSEAWSICKERPFIAIGATLAITGSMLVGNVSLTMIQTLIRAKIFGATAELSVGTFGLTAMFWLVKALVSSLLGGLLVTLWLRLVHRQDVDASMFTTLLKGLPAWIACSLFIQFSTTLGFMMLIIPGVIMSFGWLLAPYYVFDKGLGPVEAIRMSWRSTMGSKLELFGTHIMLIVMFFAAVIPLGLGLPIAIPVASGVLALCYHNLSLEPGTPVAKPESFEPPMPPPMQAPQ